MTFKSVLRLGTIVAGFTAISAPALAQSGIEVVTVTAAKREQDVQNVPISMNVVTQKDLEKFNLSDLKDIAAQVPGLTIVRGQTLNAFYLRGFGTGAGTNPALEQSVSLYVDGVYAGRAREYMAPLFDMGRLEVLRGPQGSLLGKNTAAGAINMVSNNPTDEFHWGGTFAYLFDRAKGIDASGYVSGPVTDTLNARLAVKIVDKDGWLNNIATGTMDPRVSSQGGRLTLEWQPTESLHTRTKYEFDHVDQNGRLTVGYPTGTTRAQVNNFNQNNPGIIGELGDLDNSNSHHFSNLIEYDTGDITLVSQTGVTVFTSRSVAGATHLPPETISTDYRDSFQQYMQEFRAVSPTGQTLEWIAGIYGDYSRYRVDNIFRYKGFPAAASAGALSYSQNTDAYTISGYATLTWNITDDFRAVVGGRGTYISRDGTYTRTLNLPAYGATVFPGNSALTVPSTNKTESSFDPSIALQYDLTDDVHTYASFAQGSKGGAFQATRSTIVNATTNTFYVKPERSTAFEVGIKSKLWDVVTANIAAFFVKFKNLQVSQYVVLTPGGLPTLTSTNAATAESKGVELVVNADLDQWIEGLTVGLSGAYTDNRFTDYPGAPCTFASTLASGGNCGTAIPPGFAALQPGVFGTGPNAGQAFNGKGLSTNGAPQWQGTLTVNYSRLLMDELKLDSSIGFDMQSHLWFDAGVYNAASGLQSSNTKINLRIGFGAPDDSWNVAFVGYNIFDVLTTSGTFAFPPAIVYSVDEGRRLSVQLALKM